MKRAVALLAAGFLAALAAAQNNVHRYGPAMIRKDVIPPASLMEAPQLTMALSFGITMCSVAAGAHFSEVVAGSTGAQVGLTSGMAVTPANDVALADLGQAAVKVLGASAGEFTLHTAAGEKIVVKP